MLSMAIKNRLHLVLAVILTLVINTDAIAGVETIAPDEACQLLDDIGLSTLGWKTYDDNESKCASRSVQLGSGNPFKNSLAFYVEGIGQTVHQLKLIVSVLNPGETDKAHAALKKVTQNLLMKLTNKPAPENILTAISDGKNLTSKTANFTVDVVRREWTMTTDWATINCHEIAVTIK
jgi:hypothetical protein